MSREEQSLPTQVSWNQVVYLWINSKLLKQKASGIAALRFDKTTGTMVYFWAFSTTVSALYDTGFITVWNISASWFFVCLWTLVLFTLLTLLSLSSSFLSHSKSLYLLLTVDSFSLKIGRFVWKQEHKLLIRQIRSFDKQKKEPSC